VLIVWRCEGFLPKFPRICPKKIWTTFCANIFSWRPHFGWLPEKVFKWFWAPFFSNQRTLGAILALIFREFDKVFGDFAKVSQILPRFSGIFSRIFTRLKDLGCLHPTNCTTGLLRHCKGRESCETFVQGNRQLHDSFGQKSKWSTLISGRTLSILRYVKKTVGLHFQTYCASEVAGVTFSDSDSTPVPKFLNPGPDPGPEIFLILESESCSESDYNHRSNRNLPRFLLKICPHRLLLLPRLKSDSGPGPFFSKIFDSLSGSERKTQNPAGVDSGTPDPVPPLLCIAPKGF